MSLIETIEHMFNKGKRLDDKLFLTHEVVHLEKFLYNKIQKSEQTENELQKSTLLEKAENIALSYIHSDEKKSSLFKPEQLCYVNFLLGYIYHKRSDVNTGRARMQRGFDLLEKNIVNLSKDRELVRSKKDMDKTQFYNDEIGKNHQKYINCLNMLLKLDEYRNTEQKTEFNALTFKVYTKIEELIKKYSLPDSKETVIYSVADHDPGKVPEIKKTLNNLNILYKS